MVKEFKIVKTSLPQILKHKELHASKIYDLVITFHQIHIHTLHFLNLFLIHQFQNNKNFTFKKNLISQDRKSVV